MMKTMTRAMFGVAVAALSATPIWAADLPVRAPVPVAPAYDWTGFYVGLNMGLGWTNESYHTAPGGTTVTVPVDGSEAWFEHVSGSSPADLTVGVEAGYNQQVSNWLWGVETDFQY